MPFEKDLTLRFSVLLQTYAGTRVWEGCLAWVSLRGHLIPWASFPPLVPNSSSCHVWWQPRMAWRAGTAVLVVKYRWPLADSPTPVFHTRT